MSAKVWVIDDDEIVRGLLSTILKDLGYVVELFSRGKEVLSRLDEESPDVFIVDMRMPEMNGIDLTRAIIGKYPEAIVIIMTAYPTIDDAVEAIQLGASDYLSKPFDKAQIQVRVGRLLERRKHQTHLKRTHLVTRTLVETLPIWIILGMLAARYFW